MEKRKKENSNQKGQLKGLNSLPLGKDVEYKRGGVGDC